MAGQGSARVTLKEIDLSQVRDPEQLPQGVPAAVVGPAKRGPAFVPKTFATIQQFSETFGNMLEVKKTSNANLFGPLALNEWMKNSSAGTYIRVLGVGDGKKSDTHGKVTDAELIMNKFGKLPSKLDAAFGWNYDEKTYFFKGRYIYRINDKKKTIEDA